MKKLALFIICFSAVITTAVAKYNHAPLPETAQKFITQHFPKQQVKFVDVDDDGYEVKLTRNTEIDFDRAGNWKEVDCESKKVPEKIIPQKINQFIMDRYPKAKVIKIERNTRGYEVNLSNNKELIFDAQFNFLGIDY